MRRRNAKLLSGKLGESKPTEHRIELKPGCTPHRKIPYRQGSPMRQTTKEQIGEQLDAGVIETSRREWASPVGFTSQKDGKMRFCLDYRRLNQATIPDSHPLPRLDDCPDSLGTRKYFRRSTRWPAIGKFPYGTKIEVRLPLQPIWVHINIGVCRLDSATRL